jgi:uncharacterized iron-regulated membrane protein
MRNSRSKLLKAFGKLHLWLGLISGLVVFVISIGAMVFVWEEELTDLFYSKKVFVSEVKSKKLPLTSLWGTARKYAIDKEVQDVEIKSDNRRAYIFTAYKENAAPGLFYFSQYEYWDKIFIDPYTGKILGVNDMRYEPIYLFRVLHQQLLFSYDIGHWFTAIATLIFFFMIISGLVLWFPRNKAALKQRFKIKWKASWKRWNYDLHSVGGFYTHLFILLFAITGLVWSFDWWTNGIYQILGDNPETVFAKEKTDNPIILTDSKHNYIEDRVLKDVIGKRSHWSNMYISQAGAYGSDLNLIAVYLNFKGESGWDESDNYYYHPQTGDLFHQVKQEDKSLGEKWRNSNYAIHVGSIYGVPTKILAFLVAFICAMLPLTGFLIWISRNKRNKIKENIFKHS